MKILIADLESARSKYSIYGIFDRQKWIFPSWVKISDFLTREIDRQTKIFFDQSMYLKILILEI